MDVATILKFPVCQHRLFFYLSIISSVDFWCIELFAFLVDCVCAFEPKATRILRNRFTTELDPRCSLLPVLLSTFVLSRTDPRRSGETQVEHVSSCSSQKASLCPLSFLPNVTPLLFHLNNYSLFILNQQSPRI